MVAGRTHVAQESTGTYGRPVYQILEERVTRLLVNAAHVSKVPGRKTDVKNCEWIAEFLEHGFVRGSFVPHAPLRELRELTRSRRQLIEAHSRQANRVQKVLETANIKLVLHSVLTHLEFLESQIGEFDSRIAAASQSHTPALDRVDTIPGVACRSGEQIIAELGTNPTVTLVLANIQKTTAISSARFTYKVTGYHFANSPIYQQQLSLFHLEVLRLDVAVTEHDPRRAGPVFVEIRRFEPLALLRGIHQRNVIRARG